MSEVSENKVLSFIRSPAFTYIIFALLTVSAGAFIALGLMQHKEPFMTVCVNGGRVLYENTGPDDRPGRTCSYGRIVRED